MFIALMHLSRRRTNKIEKPGSFLSIPCMATLITGAARLMLGDHRKQGYQRWLDWAFCDTDSMAIRHAEGMESDDFMRRVGGVREWFTPLNPYTKRVPFLSWKSRTSVKTRRR